MMAVITILAFALMAAGIILSLRPGLPGPVIVLIGAAVYGIFSKFERVGIGSLAVMALLVAAAYLPDLMSSLMKGDHLRPSHQAGLGMIVGGFLGFLMFGALGIILGIFVGAFMAELVFAENSGKNSAKIALNGLLLFLQKRLAKLLISVAMAIMFLATAF